MDRDAALDDLLELLAKWLVDDLQADQCKESKVKDENKSDEARTPKPEA